MTEITEKSVKKIEGLGTDISKDQIKTNPETIPEEKITLDRNLRNDMKRREKDQTNELLIALTNELYDKVEKLTMKSDKSNQESTKDLSSGNDLDKTIKNNEIKFTFSDLSWYKRRLNGEKI